jgi:hypothetical protein
MLYCRGLKYLLRVTLTVKSHTTTRQSQPALLFAIVLLFVSAGTLSQLM